MFSTENVLKSRPTCYEGYSLFLLQLYFVLFSIDIVRAWHLDVVKVLDAKINRLSEENKYEDDDDGQDGQDDEDQIIEGRA